MLKNGLNERTKAMRDTTKQTEESWATNSLLTGISKSDEDTYRDANWAIEQAIVLGENLYELEGTAMKILIARDRLFRRMLYLKEKQHKEQ